MITMAVNTEDSLVKDDYYKEGRMINLELIKDQLAQQLNLSAQLTFDKNAFSIRLTGAEGFQAPDMVALQIIHPTRNKADISTMVVNNGANYFGEVSHELEGRRYFQLSDPQSTWRIKGEAWLPSSNPIKLVPSVPKDD